MIQNMIQYKMKNKKNDIIYIYYDGKIDHYIFLGRTKY